MGFSEFLERLKKFKINLDYNPDEESCASISVQDKETNFGGNVVIKEVKGKKPTITAEIGFDDKITENQEIITLEKRNG